MMFGKAEISPFKLICIAAAVAAAAVIYSLFCFSDTGKHFWESAEKLLGLTNFSDYAEDFDINIHVIDVGKADAILVEQGDTFVLVDGGTFHSSERVIEYLKTRNIHRLDTVIASHPDTDHIGGIPAVINEFGADLFCSTEFPDGASRETEILKTAVADIPSKTLNAGDEFFIGEIQFTVLAPAKRYEDSNDNSLVIKIRFKDFSMLFTGDMAEKELSDLLDSGADLASDILKISHHGSKTGTNEEFLLKAAPEISIISVGDNTSYLPSEETVKSASSCSKVLRTDEMGDIIISSDGDGKYTFLMSQQKNSD